LRLRIGLAQLEIRDGDFEYNLSKGVDSIKRLGSNIDLVILPELWITGYGKKNIMNFINNEKLYKEVLNTMVDLSRKFNVTLVIPMPERLGDTIYNSALIIHDGVITGLYRKIHLFSLYNEDEIFSKGKNVEVFDLGGYKLGVAMCYDLRFPELFRILSLKGADLIAVPASWGYPRLMQWRTLLRARAIENQVFIIGVNRVGYSELVKESFAGNSCVIDPLGNEILCLGIHEAVTHVDIELSLIHEARKYLPLWKDRRSDIYDIIVKSG